MSGVSQNQNIYEKIKLTAYSVPSTCMLLKDQIFHIKEHCFEYLIDFGFANYSEGGDKIDCLVGGDFY